MKKLVLKAQVVMDLIEEDGSRCVKLELPGTVAPSFEILITPDDSHYEVEIHHSGAPGLPPLKLHIPNSHDLAGIQRLYDGIKQAIFPEYNGKAAELRSNPEERKKLQAEYRLRMQDLLADLLKSFTKAPVPKYF